MDDIIILYDENGEEEEYEYLHLIEYNDEEYVVLLPVAESEDEPGQVMILKLVNNGSEDTEEYESVDDDEVLDAVFQIFKEEFADDFNFVD